MLASIGTRSGQTFVEAMNGPGGLWLFIAGAIISLVIPFVLLPVLYKKFKLPFAISAGIMAAAHTQPAVQAYAVQQAGNDLPNHGYAIVFPTAIILKIILAQVLLISLYSIG
jgi:putative transport protein